MQLSTNVTTLVRSTSNTMLKLKLKPKPHQDPAWKNKEKAEEGRYARAKEQEALQAIRDELAQTQQPAKSELDVDKDIEGGYGGQEELEDRYATTLGMH
ncbi:hypothetical protein ACG7TL_002983 [Trametes sanguinea]